MMAPTGPCFFCKSALERSSNAPWLFAFNAALFRQPPRRNTSTRTHARRDDVIRQQGNPRRATTPVDRIYRALELRQSDLLPVQSPAAISKVTRDRISERAVKAEDRNAPAKRASSQLFQTGNTGFHWNRETWGRLLNVHSLRELLGVVYLNLQTYRGLYELYATVPDLHRALLRCQAQHTPSQILAAFSMIKVALTSRGIPRPRLYDMEFDCTLAAGSIAGLDSLLRSMNASSHQLEPSQISRVIELLVNHGSRPRAGKRRHYLTFWHGLRPAWAQRQSIELLTGATFSKGCLETKAVSPTSVLPTKHSVVSHIPKTDVPLLSSYIFALGKLQAGSELWREWNRLRNLIFLRASKLTAALTPSEVESSPAHLLFSAFVGGFAESNNLAAITRLLDDAGRVAPLLVTPAIWATVLRKFRPTPSISRPADVHGRPNTLLDRLCKQFAVNGESCQLKAVAKKMDGEGSEQAWFEWATAMEEVITRPTADYLPLIERTLGVSER